MSRIHTLLLALSLTFFVVYFVKPTPLDRSSDKEDVSVEATGRRRLLGGSKWKKRKSCPPGLKMCLEEEKVLAAEKAERKAAREEEEAKAAAELEEASSKRAGEREAKASEREAANVEKQLAKEAEARAVKETEEAGKHRQKALFKGFMKDRKREAPTSEDLRLLQLELKYRQKAAATPLSSGAGGEREGGGKSGDEIDAKTLEPKAWKKKRKEAIKVSFDGSGGLEGGDSGGASGGDGEAKSQGKGAVHKIVAKASASMHAAIGGTAAAAGGKGGVGKHGGGGHTEGTAAAAAAAAATTGGGSEEGGDGDGGGPLSLLAVGRAAEVKACGSVGCSSNRKLKKHNGGGGQKHHHKKHPTNENADQADSGESSEGGGTHDSGGLAHPDRPHSNVRPGTTSSGGSGGGGTSNTKQRPKSAVELVTEGMAAGRRILIYAPAGSGGALLAYTLAQLPGSVAILNLRNSQLPPTPEELGDVPSEATVVVKASSDSDYSLFDYIKAFRPHVKVLCVRHPAHVRAGLLRAKLDSYREMPGPDTVLQRLEEAFKGSEKRYDAVFLYEELVWNRVLTEQKLASIGFNQEQMDKMFSYPRPVSAVVSYSQQKCKWISERKMVGWDAGNVKKLGAGSDTVKASFIDRRPTIEDREKAFSKAPTLSKHYRLYYPELDAAEGVSEWVKTVQLLMKKVAARKDSATNTVVMTIADHRWQDLVVNWMAALHRLGVKNYLVVSADAQLHDALTRIGAPSFYHSVFFNPYGGAQNNGGWDGKEASQGSAEGGARAERYRGAMWSYKWQLVGAVLKRGVHVVLVDVDAVPVRTFDQLLTMNQGSHIILSRGSKVTQDALGLGWAYFKSSPQTLTFLPKFQALAQKVLDDQRALNLALNTGFVKWAHPVLQDGETIDGVASSGLKVSLLPNLQVRAHCDSGEYPAQTAFVVHCKIPRTQKPSERMQLLTKYGVWLLRENFQFVEYPGNFEAWLDVVIDTRSLAYTVMTQQTKKGRGGMGGGMGAGGLFSVGAKATPALVNLNRAPVVPLQNQPGVSPGNRGGTMRMGIGMAAGA